MIHPPRRTECSRAHLSTPGIGPLPRRGSGAAFRLGLSWALALVVGVGLTACTPQEDAGAAPAGGEGAQAACPDGAARLPVSGLCPSEAEALIQDANVGMDRSVLGDLTDCTWSVNETAFPMGEVLLYRAATCGDTVATMALHGGAHRADLILQTAAVGAAGDDAVVGFAIGADTTPPTDAIRTFVHADLEANGHDAAYIARCQVRPVGDAPDAYVVDAYAADAQPTSTDGPRSDCGQYGYTDDSYAFWRIAHGFAWYFNLGQDAYQDIDPGSLTLVARDDSGRWGPVTGASGAVSP